MVLSKYSLKNADPQKVQVPDNILFELPEKVLQFGTGALLRGLPDFFIDKANRMGIFNGRIVAVKSTENGDATAFEKQDNLYTLCVRGIENEIKVEESIICSAISRVLYAAKEWDTILECAHNPQLQVIISNTTEVGIQLVHDDVRRHPPVSFPGKLLAFLLERYHAFEGSHQSGMVILPTELITNNGSKLESIVLELAHLNALDERFIEWLESSNYFCNTLVDRIVPGKPDAEARKMIQEEIGAGDELITLCEPYRLWAIQGDENISDILSFAKADNGIVITPSIELFSKLKLGMLKGTSILASGVALLSGINATDEAMRNEIVAHYIRQLLLNEIAPSIDDNLNPGQVKDFSITVLDRLANPYIQQQWFSTTTNYTSKMQALIVPLIEKYFDLFGSVPENIATGFAAYLLFMKGVKCDSGVYLGVCNGKEYAINDDRAGYYFQLWHKGNIAKLVTESLGNLDFWGVDLSLLPGFAAEIADKLQCMVDNGVPGAIMTKKIVL